MAFGIIILDEAAVQYRLHGLITLDQSRRYIGQSTLSSFVRMDGGVAFARTVFAGASPSSST